MFDQKTENFSLTGCYQCLAGRNTKLVVRIVKHCISKGIDFVFLVLLHSIKAFTDAGYQFFGIEGFRQVIVGTHLESFQSVGLVGAVGQKENLGLLVRITDATGYLITVYFGHIDVEQNQVGLHFGVLLQGDASVSGIIHFVSLGFEEAYQDEGIFQVVIGKEYFQCFLRLLRYFDGECRSFSRLAL